ncbi:hypothetical protein DBR42_17915 [Pelomonas sp. HMWF004]|nr:hypothetical protein DBR42_17915 [Pelomonas sp. HMWF004]
MSQRLTYNQCVLAALIARNAIDKARAPEAQLPTLLKALGEAITAKSCDIAQLAAAGRTTDERHREGLAQLERWRSVWIANR